MLKAQQERETRERQRLVNELVTLEKLSYTPTMRGTACWTGFAKYDGQRVNVYIWGEHLDMLRAAGHPVDTWKAQCWQSPTAIPINADVILGWKQSCGYTIKEVVERDPDEIAVEQAELAKDNRKVQVRI